MKRTILFWALAVILTVASAIYQRVTGPTYPLSGKTILDGKEITYKLERSFESTNNYLIKIETNDASVKGILYWRKFNSNRVYTVVPMVGSKIIEATLPAQKRLEKLEYYITLSSQNKTVTIPNEKVATIRFKDPVPNWALFPHILAMFFAMLLSTRTGLESFNKDTHLDKLAFWTIILLFLGGFPLGFAMNGLAFGEMWGGWPFGNDVTDNKTQAAFIIWLIAFYFIKKKKNAKIAAFLAAIILFAVYMIPHSI